MADSVTRLRYCVPVSVWGVASWAVGLTLQQKEKEIMKTSSANQPAATGLSRDGVEEISAALQGLLADVFALYVKTKSFHWHMSGRHFRDYHLLLDEQAGQLFAMTDDIAERARKIGGTTLRSIGDIARHQRLKDNNA